MLEDQTEAMYNRVACHVRVESMLSGWIRKEEIFKKIPKDRRALRKGTSKHLALEAKLLEWVLEQRSHNRAVQLRDIQRKALEDTRYSDEHGFKASQIGRKFS